MFSSFRVYLAVALALLVFATPWIALNHPDQVQVFTEIFRKAAVEVAAVILHNPRTITELQTKYATSSFVMNSSTQLALSQLVNLAQSTSTSWSASTTATPSKIRILIVPGHEPDLGGAEYGSLKERKMNVELAQDLAGLLKADPHFQVFMTRDNDAWDPVFASYFKDNWNAIKAWQKDSHKEMKHLVAVGSTTAPTSKVFHNAAPVNPAFRLYGITKWSNENLVDVVIHIHFNDFADHVDGVPGKYSGFAIYVPVAQYANSTTTKAVANAVFERLKQHDQVSNLPGESSGIVDEPSLIAIGSNNTADAASMLIEYGYIYETRFNTATRREVIFKRMASDTYLGLQDFFMGDNRVAPRSF